MQINKYILFLTLALSINYLPALDITFKPTGIQPGTITTTIDNNTFNQNYRVALQSNGKIITNGTTNTGSQYNFAAARFYTHVEPPTNTTLFIERLIAKYYGSV